MVKEPAIYAVYDGDTFLTMGTADQLAVELNVKRRTIIWLASATYKNRKKDGENGRILIRVE